MTKIDRALSGDPFDVDPTQCMLLAEWLRPFAPSTATYPWGVFSTESQICFKIFFVGICHQINWDFLQDRLFSRFASGDVVQMIAVAKNATPAFVSDLLEGYHKPERIRAAERAKYLRTTALVLEEYFLGDMRRLVSSGTVFGSDGLMAQLDHIPAFSEDPLRKKSNALAQELARERIVRFVDAADIEPAIDYHLIRLYLRTGRVYAKTQSISSPLKSGVTHRPRLLKLLREATARALKITADFANLPVHELNYLEWQLGRSRCERDRMNCTGTWPVEMTDGAIRVLAECCPLKQDCAAFNRPEWQSYIEPALQIGKAYY